MVQYLAKINVGGAFTIKPVLVQHAEQRNMAFLGGVDKINGPRRRIGGEQKLRGDLIIGLNGLPQRGGIEDFRDAVYVNETFTVVQQRGYALDMPRSDGQMQRTVAAAVHVVLMTLLLQCADDQGAVGWLEEASGP